MARSTLSVPEEVRSVLAQSRIEGNKLFLPGQLERSFYMKTDKVLKVAGGRWNRKEGAHVFESDPRAILGLAVESGSIPDEKTGFQQFYSTETVRQAFRGLLCVEDHWRILEPSAGRGDLLEGVIDPRTRDRVRCIELTKKNCEYLESLGYRDVVQDDFLFCPEDPSFDLVLMNPPFDRNEWIKHIRHALRFLKVGGLLFSVIPGDRISGTVLEKITVDPVDGKEVDVDMCLTPLEEGAFKERGTSVATSILSFVRVS